MLSSVNRSNMKYVTSLLANEYVLTFTIFMVWILFFDKNNLITLHGLQQNINTLKAEKEYFESELLKLDNELKSIQVDRERYAREKFHLHKENEVVYLVR